MGAVIRMESVFEEYQLLKSPEETRYRLLKNIQL
jgi:hypothetical protein